MTKIALIQMVSSANLKDNLSMLPHFFEEAQNAGASLLILPENFAFMGRHEQDKVFLAEEAESGCIQKTIAALAKAYQLWVIAGTIPMKAENNKVRAACIVYDHQGHQVARYDKIHLFDVVVSTTEFHQESHTVEPGDKVVVVDTPVGRIGLTICYDLRFPELYRKLQESGADLFAVPAAFTAVTGQAHWEVLLRARAIENLCYVLAPNQGGKHQNGRHTYGHTMAIGPWGEIIGRLDEGSGMLVVEVELERIEKIRQQFPCNMHHVL